MPWRREQLLTPIFFSGEFHGQRSLVGYNSWSGKEYILGVCTFFVCFVFWGFFFECVHFDLFSRSLLPQGLQCSRFPCPSQSPRVCSNSCPLNLWCHLTISSSVIPFSSCLQSFPASGSFPMSPFFTSGGQSIGISASALFLPMNIQGWSPLGWTGFISWFESPRDSQESSLAPQFESINFWVLSFLYDPTLTSIHDYWKKPELWPYGPLSAKWCFSFLIHCLGLS